MRVFTFITSLLLSFLVHAAEPLVDQRNQYASVELSAYIERNQLPKELEDEKKRLMLKPKLITFNSALVTKPKLGEFSLAYDALSFWKTDEPMPVINHSAFVGDRKNGPVIGVYVTDKAAKMLNSLELDKPAAFYALHIYNYTKGPRLVIVAAESL